MKNIMDSANVNIKFKTQHPDKQSVSSELFCSVKNKNATLCVVCTLQCEVVLKTKAEKIMWEYKEGEQRETDTFRHHSLLLLNWVSQWIEMFYVRKDKGGGGK